MVNLLTESMTNNALGSMSGQPTDTGQTWAVTGDPALGVMTIADDTNTPAARVATISNGGVNGYALLDCGGAPNSFGIVLSFAAGATGSSTVCVISCRELVFVGLNMGLHFLITPTYAVPQIRETPQGGPAGAFENINMDGHPPGNYLFADGPLGGPLTLLPPDYPLSLAITLAGNVLSVVLPDGSARTYTDPRFATLVGSKIGIQSKRNLATDGRANIRSIVVDGSTPPPSYLDPIVFQRTNVETYKLDHTHHAPAHSAPTTTGDVVDCGARRFLSVENDNAVPVNVTLRSAALFLGQPVTHVVSTVPAAAGGRPGHALIPLSPRALFAIRDTGPDYGRAYVDYAVTAGIRRAVIEA